MNYHIKALQLKLINASFQRMKSAGRMKPKVYELMRGDLNESMKSIYTFTTLK